MVFHTLNKEHIKQIVTLLLKNLENRCLTQMGIELKVTGAVKEHLAEEGFDSKYGARPLRRAIQTKIEDAMANEILQGNIKRGDIVKVQICKKNICFTPIEIAEKK